MKKPRDTQEPKRFRSGMDQTAVNALNGFLENLRADRMRNSDEFQYISDELVSRYSSHSPLTLNAPQDSIQAIIVRFQKCDPPPLDE